LLTSSADGTARVWNARTAKLERALEPAAPEGSADPRTPMIGAVFDRRGERIATTDENGRVLLFDARSGAVVTAFDGDRPATLQARFSPNGDALLLREDPRTALLVDLASGRRLRLRAGEGGIECFDFSPDGSAIAIGGDDRCVSLWSARIGADAGMESESDEPRWRSRPFESEFYNLNSVFDVAFSPDGRFVSAACQNLRVRLYEARDGRLVSEGETATPGRLRWSGDGGLLLVAPKYSSFATMWRIEDAERGGRLAKADVPFAAGLHHTNSITSLSAALRAQRMVTGSLDKSVRVWDLGRHECVATYVGHADRVLDADISPDGERIVSASSDGTARLWPGDLLRAARANEPSAFAASFGPLPMPEKRD